MSRPTIADLPPRFQEQVRQQLAAVPAPRTVPAGAVLPARSVATPRLRQRQGDGLNKTERAFKAWLESRFVTVLCQSITLRLANGVRYTPDFVTVDSESRFLTAYEVKGFMRDDAAVKLKVAASVFSWIRFNLVTRAGGAWQVEEVAP
jgi:hypothetical protein